MPGRPELHARRINMFTRFSFYWVGQIFDAKSDTMGLKKQKHAGTEFIGRTDERLLDYKFCFTRQDGYLVQVHYEIIKIFKFHFIKENRIFDAKKKQHGDYFACRNRVLLGGVCIDCIRMSYM